MNEPKNKNRNESMKFGKFFKAVVLVAAFTLLCSLFGCKKKPEISAGNIVCVSTSCGHMDNSHAYSFYIVKKGESWLFSADCSPDSESERIQFDDRPVSDKDAKKLLSLVGAQGEAEKLKSYKEPKLKIFVLDETVYSSIIRFSNGETLSAKTKLSEKTVELFRRLAQKYK